MNSAPSFWLLPLGIPPQHTVQLIFAVALMAIGIYGFVLCILGLIYRLALRVVAGFYPSLGTVVFALLLSILADIGIKIGGLIAVHPPTSRSILVILLAALLVQIWIFAVRIKLPAGGNLGMWKSFLACLVCRIFYLGIDLAVFLTVIGFVGPTRFMAEYRNARAQAQSHPASAQAANWPSWLAPFIPAASPAISPAPAQLGVGSHLFLKDPVVIHVAYGDITIPAGTEAVLIEQVGDSCRVQVSNNTFTVSRGELSTDRQ